jgi:hypothetical protein
MELELHRVVLVVRDDFFDRPQRCSLGETIIDANDINSPKEELFIKFFVNGIIGGPFYELGYKVLPG